MCHDATVRGRHDATTSHDARSKGLRIYDGYWGGGHYTDEEAVGKLRISLIVNDLWCKCKI